MLRPARAGRGGVRVGRRARCRQKLGLGVSPLEDRWSNGLFFLIASGYQPPLAKVATPPPRYVASVATAPERCSWMSASPVTSVRRQPPRTVRERPRPSARMVTGRPRAPYRCTRSPRVAPHTSPSRRLRTFPLPVAPTRANVDGRRLPAAATTRRDPAHDPARDRLDRHPRYLPRETAPPAGTFGPQGPTLGDLIDAYLQDYHVRQFRSQSTARGRTAHLAAFFGRAARAATLTTYHIRQYQLARRAAG